MLSTATMYPIYFWIAVIAGSFFILALISDQLVGLGDDTINVALGTLLTFGSIGVILSKFTDTTPEWIFVISISLSCILFVVLKFVILPPLRKAETTTGFSITEMVGKKAVVTIAIPEKGNGAGEILLSVVGARSTFIAESFDGQPIKEDEEVIIMEIEDNVAKVMTLDILERTGGRLTL